jgi:hypothetical protein
MLDSEYQKTSQNRTDFLSLVCSKLVFWSGFQTAFSKTGLEIKWWMVLCLEIQCLDHLKTGLVRLSNLDCTVTIGFPNFLVFKWSFSKNNLCPEIECYDHSISGQFFNGKTTLDCFKYLKNYIIYKMV